MSADVPEGWEVSAFCEAVDINPKRSVKTGECLPFVEMASVPVEGPRILRFEVKTANGSGAKFRNGDTLFARITPCVENGKTGFVDFLKDGQVGAGSTELIIFGPKPGKTDPKYVYHLARSNIVRGPAIGNMIGTTGRQRVPNWVFETISIGVPPLPEQRRIAEILSSVDDAIAATQAVIDQTRTVKQGVLKRLLTKGIGHTKFKPLPQWNVGKIANICEIPCEWELVSLSDVAELQSGHTPSRKIGEYWGEGIPWISLHDTKRLENRILSETTLTISQKGLDNSSARLLPKGTVVFSRTASVGHCVIMGQDMATSQDFANYICGDRLNNRYLLHLFRWMQGVWENLASGSTHKTIYMPTFRALKILLPPMGEQEKISMIADEFDDCIEINKERLTRLQSVKASLMPCLLTGQKRVVG
ncbi:MAG: restriction endonuclease subunit S [Rhodospirillaceae bacterium]|nr:restriction endonuclease subunit S [Rhodospirillaceae bacterium]